MAQAVDATERRARRHRLLVIIVVASVVLGGGLAWSWLANRAVASKADAARSELREQWRPIDLTELSRQYLFAVTAANDSGARGKASRLFPQTNESRFFMAEFRARDVVAAQYVVSAAGVERCLSVLISGPTPNRLEFRQRDGDC